MAKIFSFSVKFFTQYKNLVLYGIVGVFSTLLNIALFRLFSEVLRVQYLAANAIAWVLGVGIVFIANKYIVFSCRKSDKNTILHEASMFFASRLLSGILDIAIMFVMVDILANGNMIAKIFDNIIIIVFNYFASKFVVFKSGNAEIFDESRKEASNG